MKNLYLDIETLPTSNSVVIEHLRAKLKPPGNYSKPETIAKWHSDPGHLNEAVAKTGLCGAFGQIACMGLAGDCGQVHILTGDEKTILTDFHQILTRHDESKTPEGVKLIGHNILAFDLPFISQRMLVHGLGPLIPFNARPWEINAGDTMTMFMSMTREMISLSNLCLALGIEKEADTITGADVHRVWLNGDHETVFNHCASDVKATRACYQHMVQMGEAEMGFELELEVVPDVVTRQAASAA